MNAKIITLLILTASCQLATANETSTEINLLKQQIKMLSERLDRIEKGERENSALLATVSKAVTPSPSPSSSPAPTLNLAKASVFDRLSFKSDFRQRFESIEQQGKVDRDRNRFRLRAALGMAVNNRLNITLGIATGGDDPVSTNQTLDGAFSTKDLRLDLAYFDYKLTDIYSLNGGKIKNPFYKPGKNSAFWDSDLNPEGFALKFNSSSIQGSLVAFSVEERKSAGDSYMIGGQAMHGFSVSDGTLINVGLGYYDYSDLEGKEALYDGKPRGNSVDLAGNYLNDYNIVEAFAEYKAKLMGKPFSVYGNYFQNTAANSLDSAYTVGVKYGKVRGAGSWDIGLAYLDIEADAVVGLFNDSDFAGGNTDSKGLSLKLNYGIKKNMTLGLIYINSEFGQSQVNQVDYDRLQLDFKLNFKP